MKNLTVAAASLLVATVAFAAAPTPEEAWKADLASTNLAYSLKPHAILKIQDAAYLGEGNSASLVGVKGKPSTYKWKPGAGGGGVVVATYKGGKLALTKDGKAVTNPFADLAIDTDVDLQAYPTQVQAGVMGVRIFVYNQKNPNAKAFHGVDYFPYDPSYVVKGSFTADAKLPARTFRTSRGTDKQFYHAGDVTFALQGRRFTLPMYSDSREPKQIGEMSSFFTDALTGRETYGAGRYVDVTGFGAYPPKTVTIDFNYAYNPNCARSPFYTCPVAMDELKLAMKAGERDPHAHVK